MESRRLHTWLTGIACFIFCSAPAQVIHFIFTSDLHYGITRPHFRGDDSVRSSIVNAAEVAAINSLTLQHFPKDGGIEAGEPIHYIDGIIVTGDITNREEIPIQPASVSWKEFLHDYKDGITTFNFKGKNTGLLLAPGNHDVSNAIGFTKPMKPRQDASSMAGIFTLMMRKKMSAAGYDYMRNRINYRRTTRGIHLLFINIWPDSANRVWMQKQLAGISANEPVLIFAHDPPEGDAKHFTNPNGLHGINPTDKFENLLLETYKDTGKKSTAREQKGWIDFLQQHPNIKAYFHGHSNFSEMYSYTGLQDEISLPVFRADSPLKGKYSQADESELSFDIISIDPKLRKMTVREYFWNKNEATALPWGIERTLDL